MAMMWKIFILLSNMSRDLCHRKECLILSLTFLFLVCNLQVVRPSSQQLVNINQLTLAPGETLKINTTEPSAIVVDSQGKKKILKITTEENLSFKGNFVSLPGWNYSVARIVFSKNIWIEASSIVEVFGEHSLSIESLEGNITVESLIDLSCEEAVLGGKCVGGYMPTDKPTNWSSALIPGNGPGSTSKEYLTNQSPRCIGGSGHGGRGGNPAYDDIQVYLYSGLEYGRNDYEVLLGGSSGSYLDSSALTITKPGHGGGALQLVAKQGSIIIEEKIKANAQQTKGQYEVNSGSSGGLIRLEANEVRIINAGSLEVNGAHAGKNGNTSPVWEKGSAGGAGGIVDILANKVFIATGSILLMPGNSTGCVNQTTASPGFLTIRDHSCNLRISWRNIPVFPADPAGFTWTNTTLLPPSSIPSSIAVAIQTQPSVEISTNDSPFIVTSSLPAKRESSTTASITNIYERQSKMHTSSAGVKTSFSRNGLSSTKRIQCSTDVKPVTATLSTDAVFASSPPRADIRVTRKWEDLLTSVEYLTVSIGSSRNNSWADDVYNLLQRLRTLVEEEPLTERHLNVFLKILQQFGMALSMIPSEHQETMKNIVTSLITTAESSFEKRNEQVWSTTEKLPTVLSVLENITLALWRITSVNEPFKFEHYSQRTVVQVVSLKPTRKKSVTHFMLPDISRTNQSIWKNEHNAVLIPSFNDGVVVVVSTILYRNISSIHPTTFKENRNEREKSHLVSDILSCSVQHNGPLIENTPFFPVELQFHHRNGRIPHSPICVFWDHQISAWSTEGIKTAQVDGTQARCHTTHLTSFAILTQYTEVQISAEDEFVLGIITYVGCGVSIACLFATLLVYLAFESLSTERHKIHMNLALALLLAQSLFLTGVNAIGHKTLCRVLAVCLHYLFSAVFTWMCVEGFHLYVMILSVFRADSVKMKYYYLTGWGIPVIIVGLAASIHPEGYGTIKSCWLSIHDQFIWVFLAPVVLVIVVIIIVGLAASIHPEGYGTIKSCWLSIDDQFIWVFLAPVVLVIVVNFMVLVAVIKVVANSALPSRANTDFGNVKAGVKSAVVLLPLLGVSWVFGLLTLNEKMIAFQYIFAFSTSFQGMFIFLAHCVGSSDVRSAFKRMRQRHMWARGSENAPSHIPSKVNVPVSNGIISKGNILEQKEKIRASVFSQTNSKVVKVKPPKDNFEGACLQINRTYQMSRRETTESKDCSKMTSLNCPQGAVSPKESPKRRYSSKLS
ncbi:uncharacterized protein LOC111332998 [Stylophora pistillata]|uniref:uncharacterized protein LOC111332998 n=1 Tax=Stylophora pistillata TaxID=50429 RepID=UPI000C053E5F|nr:uncharacterized protein LOC111332998 [Stylophora pistillata]